jgi:hypothetical protein
VEFHACFATLGAAVDIVPLAQRYVLITVKYRHVSPKRER